MRLAVVGASGTLGRAVVAAARERGHEVAAVSRRGSDTAKLTAALTGAAAIVDCANGSARSRAGAAPVLVDGTARLIDAAARAGVGHLVAISIVGVDRPVTGYYEAKLEQERVVEHGAVAWSLLRATQFHDLLAGLFATTARFGLVPALAGVPVQPIAAGVVAERLVELAEGAPAGRAPDLAGPEVLSMREAARTWLRAKRLRRLVVPVALPGRRGHLLREGVLCAPDRAASGSETFAHWLRGT